MTSDWLMILRKHIGYDRNAHKNIHRQSIDNLMPDYEVPDLAPYVLIHVWLVYGRRLAQCQAASACALVMVVIAITVHHKLQSAWSVRSCSNSWLLNALKNRCT